MKKFKNVLLAFVLLSVAFLNCDLENPANPDSETTPEPMLKLNIYNVPDAVVRLKAVLTRDDFDPIIQFVEVVENSALLLFENLEAGVWHLKVDALNSENEILYSGETSAEIYPNQTNRISLQLEPMGGTSGSLEVEVSWGKPDYDLIVYNFENALDENWGGPARAEIIQGKLNLWSVRGYKYHVIHPENKFYQHGSIVFEIFPGNGIYTFETKGATENTGTMNWGVWLRFEAGIVYANETENTIPIQKPTDLEFEPFNWYQVRIEFDGSKGGKGQYKIWMQNLTKNLEPQYGGEYNYYAKYDKLVGVNQISLGVYDPARETETQVIYDNFEFKVYP